MARAIGSNDLYLGHSKYPSSNHYYNGYQGRFRFYDYALTDIEVEQRYQEFVVTPAMEEIINTVFALNLQQGISNSLDTKLESAIQALDDTNSNNDVAAINSLNAFINAVEAQRGNKIPEADADELIAQAQALIATLESP